MSEFQSVERNPEPLRPESRFTIDGQSSSFSVLDFWVWVGSDVLNNAMRGKVAEYIVGQATGSWAESPVRVEWDTVDLKTPEGISIEVKSAAYSQTWHQPRPSRISFEIKKKIPWDPKTGEYGATFVRSADVYVFCLLAHRDDRTINPLDLAQWEFYVLSRHTLDAAFGDQKTVALSRLKDHGAVPVDYHELRDAILDSNSEGGMRA